MSDDAMIRREDAAKVCDDEAAKFAAKADAAAASVAAGETTNEPFFVACTLASIRLRAAAAAIRALPTVARPACLCCRDAGGDCQGGCACRSQEARARDAVLPAVAREPEERPSPPTCATCGGLGVLLADGSRLVPGGEGASSGRICPACAGGRRA